MKMLITCVMLTIAAVSVSACVGKGKAPAPIATRG